MFATLTLLAQQTGADGAAGGPPPYYQWVMIGGMVLLFYLLLLRPQQKQEKDRLRMISQLKKNDKIVNQGGIIGVVDTIKEREDEVVLRGGLRVTKSSIVRIVADEANKDQA